MSSGSNDLFLSLLHFHNGKECFKRGMFWEWWSLAHIHTKGETRCQLVKNFQSFPLPAYFLWYIAHYELQSHLCTWLSCLIPICHCLYAYEILIEYVSTTTTKLCIRYIDLLLCGLFEDPEERYTCDGQMKSFWRRKKQDTAASVAQTFA